MGNVVLLPQLFMEMPGIAEKDLIPAGKDQGGGHPRQISEQRGDQGILRVIPITPGEKGQLPVGQGHILLPVHFVALPRAGEIDPGGDGDDAPGQGDSLLPQIHTQTVAQAASGALAAQADLLRGVALA